MMIRSYTAESVASALKQVRTEMGGDAVVLKTRLVDSENGGRQYEVTACLDQPTVEQANQVLQDGPGPAPVSTDTRANRRVDFSRTGPAPARVNPDMPDRLGDIENKLELLLQAIALDRIGLPRELGAVARAAGAMQRADVPDHYIAAFLETIREVEPTEGIGGDTIREHLVEKLDDIVSPEIEFKPGDRVVAVGLAGSGKTTIIGRLAAQLVHEKNLAVKLVTLDNFKVGAADEIASYADLLGLTDVDNTVRSDEASFEHDSDKVVLIDTCALPTDETRLSELKKSVQRLKPTHRLAVFSALTRSSDIETTARRIAWLEPTHLVFTQTDLTDRLGGSLVATAATGAKLAMITNSPSGADSCQRPNPAAIADAILGQEESCE